VTVSRSEPTAWSQSCRTTWTGPFLRTSQLTSSLLSCLQTPPVSHPIDFYYKKRYFLILWHWHSTLSLIKKLVSFKCTVVPTSYLAHFSSPMFLCSRGVTFGQFTSNAAVALTDGDQPEQQQHEGCGNDSDVECSRESGVAHTFPTEQRWVGAGIDDSWGFEDQLRGSEWVGYSKGQEGYMRRVVLSCLHLVWTVGHRRLGFRMLLEVLTSED